MVNCGSGPAFAGLRHEKQKWGTVELVELLETHKCLKTQRHRHHLNVFSRSPESAEELDSPLWFSVVWLCDHKVFQLVTDMGHSIIFP